MSERTAHVSDHWEGDTAAAWAARWRLPRLEVYDRIGSTNDRAMALAESGAEPFTAVLAEEQTAGRGREGRRWESPEGSGLWISFVAPAAPPSELARVPLLAGLAVCRAIERAAPGVRAWLKWPNDVLVEGRKVSGVLCEASGTSVVVGVGVNVRPNALGSELAGSAGALDDVAEPPVDRAALAGALAAELRELLEGGPRVFDGPLARELAARDLLHGRPIAAAAGAIGVARGIDRDGALRVEVGPGDVRRVLAGGVRIRD